jgi:hypothetical protein
LTNVIKKIYSNLINNEKLLFLLVTFVAIISFGLDISAHQLYNLSPIKILENNLLSSESLYAFDYSIYSPIYYYIKFIAPILEYGILFIGASFLIKFCFFLLVYKIVSNFIERHTAIILSTVFLMAYLRASHGLIENGLWAEPVFFPASLSALATLFGIHYFINHRNLLSGISFAVSICFHPLYAITSLAFLFFGFLYSLVNKTNIYFFRNIFLVFLPILFVILYIAYFRIYITNSVELSYSIRDWYHYSGGLIDFNMSLLLSILTTGYCVVPIVITGLYLASIQKKKTILEYLTISSALMLLVFIGIELIHKNEIFINIFSEFFIATQFRRGLWVPVFFSLIQITNILFKNREEIFISKLKTLFLIIVSSTYIFPSVFAILSVYGALFFHLRNRASLILFMFSILMAIIHYKTGYFELSSQLKALSYSIIFSSSVVILIFLLKNRVSSLSVRYCIAIIIAIILIFSSRGLLQKKINDDFSILVNAGLFSKTQVSHVNDFLGSINYDIESDLCMQKISLDSKETKIQLPISGIRNSRLSLFPFGQVHGYHNPMYSRSDFELAIAGLEVIFGSVFVNSFFEDNDTYNNDYFRKAYSNIPIKQLINLRDSSELRFYILESERIDLKNLLVCQNSRYFVYDLKQL